MALLAALLVLETMTLQKQKIMGDDQADGVPIVQFSVVFDDKKPAIDPSLGHV